ncbi:hypothetical protein Tco_1113418 [Tanacetum coccineum]|uniref:Uncharacterized protein n=1 Tax=Tanacetum coccineum TaxID=301880 RepID=A0ABQ5ITN7_9ASTR
MPALMVIEGEVLNDFPRFVGILIAEFALGGAVHSRSVILDVGLYSGLSLWRFAVLHGRKSLSMEAVSKIRIWVMDQAEDVQPFSMLNAEGE